MKMRQLIFLAVLGISFGEFDVNQKVQKAGSGEESNPVSCSLTAAPPGFVRGYARPSKPDACDLMLGYCSFPSALPRSLKSQPFE